MKYALIIFAFLAIGSITYALNIETDPNKIIEKKNRENMILCLKNVQSKTGSTSMKKEMKKCIDLPLLTISNSLLSSPGEVPIHKNQIDSLHQKICNKQINSPLCKDKSLYDRLYKITEERLPGQNFFPILVGMTNAESSLGLDFAKDNTGGKCDGRNNWGGAKYRINDDNTRTYKRNHNGFDYTYPIDQFGCNLFPFESIEEYWTSKVNGIRYGYKGCIDSDTPIKCIAFKYVGNPDIAEPGWIDNVSSFL